MYQYQLIVVGGGFTGVAAAISGARCGLKVLLIEKANCLGGAATNCLVNPFMTNATRIQKGEKTEYTELSRGIFAEIVEELKNIGAYECGGFHEEYLKLVLNRMVLQSGAELLFHSYLIDVKKTGETIESITVANKSGKQEFFADYFIDATGDADLAVLAGCPFHLGREKDNLCQPMTLCFRIANVDIDGFWKTREKINPLYQQFQREGKIKNIREDVLIFRNLVNGVLHFNSTRVVKLNPVDAFDLTKAEIDAREQAIELYNFLKENIECFRNSQLLFTAPEIGVRESRMIDGEYLLTGKDLVDCIAFEDAIALGNYDIDIHNPEGSGTSHYFFPEGKYYTIPYRSLQPKNADNLLVAGRCISVDHEAQASIRIMPIVACLGEAAGMAVGVAAAHNCSVKQIPVCELQDQLRQQGAAIE